MNKKLVMGLIIIFLMVSSIFGFIVGFGGRPPSNVQKYGDFKFRFVQNQYFAVVDGVEHGFLFFPGDLEYITVPDEVKTLLEKPALTVTYEPDGNLTQNLGAAQYYFEAQLQDKAIERALINAEGTNLPQKTCADGTEAQPVVELRITDSSGISSEGNCVIVSAIDEYDLYQQTERLIYDVLGVMQ